MRLAYITAGAGGMFCGSCMHDNALARALMKHCTDVQLIPTYTPIRTDEDNFSVDRVFFGGINIYLQQIFPPFRYLPKWVDRLLDSPTLIRWVTSRYQSTDPKQLGALTVSMLNAEAGVLRKEVKVLGDFLEEHVQPDVINLTNILIGGMTPYLKQRFKCKMFCTLQGDDIFLDYLPEKYRGQALARIAELDSAFDGYIAHSHFYADYMADYLGISRSKFHITPLGLDVRDFPTPEQWSPPPSFSGKPRSICYIARLAPAKGLHVLVDSFLALKKDDRFADLRLDIAGYLGDSDKEFAAEQFKKLDNAGLSDSYTYHGSVDRLEKIALLLRSDLACVPATYREPKGLYALEAMAAGRPIVLSDHGAFPEMIAAAGGGILAIPGDAADTAEKLAKLLENAVERENLGRSAQITVHTRFDAAAMSNATYAALSSGDKAFSQNNLEQNKETTAV
jgi:glycosyltransferase involved in cell wall biosynthesis